MEDLVEDVAQFVEGIVLRAIHAQHAIVRPLPLVLFVVLAGMVKASRNVGEGVIVRLHDTCARTLGTRMARTASLVPLFISLLSVWHTREHANKDRSRAFDPVLVHRVAEDPSIAAEHELKLGL